MEIVTALCKSVFKKIFLKGTYNWDISGMRMIPPALRATFLFKGGLFFYHVPLEKAPVGCALCWDVPKGQGDNPSVCSLRSIHLPFQGRHIYRPRWDAIRFSISSTLESMWASTSTGVLQRAKMPEKRKKSLSGTALSRQALFVIWCCDPVSRWFIFFGYPGTGRLRTCL